MKHKAAVILLTAVFSAGTIFPAMAGSWQKNEAGWWYRNDDGSWPAGIWQWVDGNSDGAAECYYFDSNGYMLESTVTPDGYMVNENGAWTVDGTVQTKQVQSGKTSGSDGWHYENGGWKYYENGSFLRNAWKYTRGNWYYFSGNGNMATGLIYVSDHGESLGENNLYLHGLPYAIAPNEQTKVPFLVWLSPQLKTSAKLDEICLKNKAEQGTHSHDNLFHSVLGLLDIQTKVYNPKLDIFQSCRK